jgi:hypothetical protein
MIGEDEREKIVDEIRFRYFSDIDQNEALDYQERMLEKLNEGKMTK